MNKENFKQYDRGKKHDYLKNVCIILDNCKDIEEINQVLSEKLYELFPNSVIILTSSYDAREFSKVSKIIGLDRTFNLVRKKLKFEPLEFKMAVKERSLADIEKYATAKVFRIEGGLYKILNGRINKFVARAIEKMHSVNFTYGVGISSDSIIYGTIFLFVKEEINQEKKSVLNELIKYSGLIIKQKFAEKNEGYKFDKYRQIFENINYGLLSVDSEGNLLYANKKSQELLKLDDSKIVNSNIKGIIEGVKAEEILDKIKQSLNNFVFLDSKFSLDDKKEIHIKISPLFDQSKEEAIAVLTMTDISRQKQLEEELFHTNNILKESYKLRTEFLLNFSHEIRSLMNAIVGFSQLIKECNSLDEAIDYSEVIKSNSDELLHILNDIIDIAKIETGTIKVDISEFSLNNMLIQLYEKYTKNHKFKESRINLKIAKNPADVIFTSDKQKISQIFNHLLDNAFKFTEKGEIEFGYFYKEPENKNTLTFFVKDSGIGISETIKPKIFTPFYQSEEINTRNYNGSGIGLSLISSYIKVLKGEIYFESQENNGTSFFFHL